MKAAAKLLFIAVIIIAALSTARAQDNSQQDTVYMFSFFKGNGETGLHLAYSFDCLEWHELGDGQSFMRPAVGSELVRDPSIVQGPDGMFHMVWTTGWWDQGIGLAHSEDLIHWSDQTFLPVMEHQEGARNCWAPEIFYDEKTDKFLIVWATTIEGKFPETADAGDHNHRQYYVSTEDFETYTDTELFYEPGFNVIDAFIARDEENDRYLMVVKDETRHPPEKNLRITFADNAEGPWGSVSEPITGDYWAEGPSAVKVDGRWIVFFDKYIEWTYGAVASDDLQNWEDISDQISFPSETRHGTVFQVDRQVLDNLLSYE